MSRLAVIDCGTNTFNLLIVDVLSDSQYKSVFQTRSPVKLGEALINKSVIQEEAYQRGIAAIESFKNFCVSHQTQQILAFATSAVRDASNGQMFVNEVQKRFGITIQVINGNREAELIYKGVIKAVQMKTEPSLIMDIGGGSNEYIIADKNQLLWKGSFNIGAARILLKFPFSDPATDKEILEVKNFLKHELTPLLSAVSQFKPVELIGASGAFDSFLELINHSKNGNSVEILKTENEIRMEDYRNISAKIKASTNEQRKVMPGLVPMRVDMIVISAVMIDMILEQSGVKTMRVSAYSLKEGALIDYISNKK